MAIYVLRGGEDGPIKIGRGGSPRGRLVDCQVGNWVELQLIASVETCDDVGEEKKYHRLCAKDHIRGEWFNPTPEVLAVVEEIKARKPQTLQDYAAEIVADYRRSLRIYFCAAMKALADRHAKPVHQG